MKASILGLLAVTLLVGPLGARASSVSYAVAVTDFGEPSTFSFGFGTPISSIAGLASFSFVGSFTLTDPTGDGVSVSNGGTIPEYWRLSVGNPLTSIGDVGGNLALSGVGPHNFSASGTFDCATIGGCSYLQIDLVFTASGNSDVISSTGKLDLNPASVPEPGTLALLGLGLAGLGLSRRRKAN